jgi:hypothetical protein
MGNKLALPWIECKENDPLNQLAAVVLLLQRDVADLTLILNMQY